MRSIFRIFIIASLSVFAAACHDYEDFGEDANGNFDCLWSAIDTHYCFFPEKNIDWKAIGEQYRARIHPGMTQTEFFALCSEMLYELKDGHVNLISPFDASYYRAWWSDYPQDFNLRVLQQYYLDFNYHTASGMIYKTLPGNVAYIYYPSFSPKIGEGNLDYILMSFKDCNGLIIDVRDNGGGELSNVHTLVGRFISEPIIGGYICHKTGPGHNDFSAPYPMEYKPASPGHICWEGKVAVLTNRSCFSAANDFVAVMKLLPNVEIIGAPTGGGGGMPFYAELPIGWSVRFSASPVTDAAGNSIESGIDPSPGCLVHSSEADFLNGKDPILDFAILRLSAQ